MRYIIANWKATKNLKEAQGWMKTFSHFLLKDKKLLGKLNDHQLTIIICPSHQHLYPVRQLLPSVPNIKLGAQDVSFFERGNYTGEVSASNLAELVDFVIIGHSERRKYFKEANNIIDQKTMLALDNEISPIVCVRNESDLIPDKATFIAYEPVYAIGTGNNEPVDKVLQMKQKLHLQKDMVFLYGGSLDDKNMVPYLSVPEIGGFFVGTASFHSETFYKMAGQL